VKADPNSDKEGSIDQITITPRIIAALNMVNRGQGNLIALAFYMWSFAGGKFDRGLLSRRIKEANLVPIWLRPMMALFMFDFGAGDVYPLPI
jgi:hypothetical protein